MMSCELDELPPHEWIHVMLQCDVEEGNMQNVGQSEIKRRAKSNEMLPLRGGRTGVYFSFFFFFFLQL